MSTPFKLFIVIISLLFNCGCWDQDILKDDRLIYGMGFDSTPNNQLLTTIVIRNVEPGEQATPSDETHSATGNTPRQILDALDRQVSGQLRYFKTRVVLVGEERAKKDLYPILDDFYRNPKASLNARLAVVEGKAADLLALNKVGNTLIGEYLDGLIESEEENTIVSKVNIQSICPILLDPGQDILLPYLRVSKGKVELAGSAMFHNQTFTGILSATESTLYLLLNGEKGEEVAKFTLKANHLSKEKISNYININTIGLKRKMKVNVSSKGKIDVDLNIKLQVNVQEYPLDRLEEKVTIQKLNQKLSKILTQEAKHVIDKMQKAGCDAFGVGRQLMAFHPELWKKIDWGKKYRKVHFHPTVQVEIIGHGIIN